jgi:hypothetical protein
MMCYYCSFIPFFLNLRPLAPIEGREHSLSWRLSIFSNDLGEKFKLLDCKDRILCGCCFLKVVRKSLS